MDKDNNLWIDTGVESDLEFVDGKPQNPVHTLEEAETLMARLEEEGYDLTSPIYDIDE